MSNALGREAVPEPQNPLGIDGIEFIEFATSRPQALGGLLETMGFRPIAHHRSREVEFYRQGPMNIIVNSQPADMPRTVQPVERPVISAFAIRVRDADAAFRHARELGAWEIPPRARAMELNIPAFHGVGESLIYFVDRYDEFTIYDVDFRAIPTVDPHPPAIGGLHFFGIVQYVAADRTADWVAFYSQIFGFTALPDTVRFGIMPKGLLLESPCRGFFLQLIEPDDTAQYAPMDEHLQRIGFGTPDVMATVATLEKRGVEFLATDKVHATQRGALTKPSLGSVMFELVHNEPRSNEMIFADFGMDTASLAGPLEGKLDAMRQAGFAQAIIAANDVVGHPGGVAAGVRAVRESGLAVTGLEALRDFEGLAGRMHTYKVDVAKSMLEVCSELSGRLLLVEATTSKHANPSPDVIVRDLRMLALLAIPMGIRIAFKGVSKSRTVKDFAAAGDLVYRANCPNLGLAIDAFDVLAARIPLDDLDALDPEQVFLVQLSDFMWQSIRSDEEQAATATHFRVFPGEGAHSDELASFVNRLDALGYVGNYSFDVYNDDYQQMPAATVVQRAALAAEWLAETVLRRALPVPNMERLRRAV